MFDYLIVPLTQCLLTGVLALAGTAKLAQPTSFRETVARLGVPSLWSAGVATGVACLELLLAAALWVPLVQPAAAAAVAGLFGSFAVIGLRFRSQGIRCNCFGSLTDDTLGIKTVMRNIPLSAAAVMLWLHPASIRVFAPGDLPAWLLTTTGLILLEPLVRRVWR